MSGLTDLQAALSTSNALTSQVVALLGTLAQTGGDSDAAVETVAQAVAANNTALTVAIAQYTPTTAAPAFRPAPTPAAA